MSFASLHQEAAVFSCKNSATTLQDLIAQLLCDGNRDARSKAALALQYLALNSENAMAILQHPDALKALRFVLCNGSNEDKEYAAGALAHLAVNEEAENIIAMSDGIISALASLIICGSDKGKLQAAAALENLSVSNALLVCNQDGVVVGLTQLLLNTESTKGMEAAVAVIQNLALVPECRTKLQDIALFRGLVNNLLFGTLKAKEDSAAAIGNLAASEDISEEAMLTPCLVDGLIDLLTVGSDRGKSDAATAIGNLATKKKMRSKILDHPNLLSGLNSMLSGSSERHRGEAAFCLQNLSICDVSQKTRIAKFGRIMQGLVNLISKPNLLAQYQEDASSAILNLVVGCTDNKKMAVSTENFMKGIIFCMRHGSDRSQENSTAILQNLAFSDHENRMFIVQHPEALNLLGELILIGSHRTQEYALAAVASIARSKQGGIALLEVRGMVESLVMMTQSSVLNICTHAVSALQALAQFKQTADTLVRNLVPSRAFIPLLQMAGVNEQMQRIQVLSAVGLTSLSIFDTRIVDFVPQSAAVVLISTLRSFLQSSNVLNSKTPVQDVLRSLSVMSQKADVREFIADTFSQELVNSLGVDPTSLGFDSFVLEGIKLCWNLSFYQDSRSKLIDAGIANVLANFRLADFAECKEVQFWASGTMLQLQLLDINLFSIGLNKNEDKPFESEGNFFIVHDISDRYVVNKIESVLTDCGYVNKNQLCALSEAQWHSMDLLNFSSALSSRAWIFVALSNRSELNPYCRFKMERAFSNGNEVVPLNVEAGYVPHAHYDRWPVVFQCSDEILQSGKSGLLLELVRKLRVPARLAVSAQDPQLATSKEMLKSSAEIALTLALEYSAVKNIDEFCNLLRLDVSSASGLGLEYVRVKNIVAGKATSLDLSEFENLNSHITITLTLHQEGSDSSLKLAKGLALQAQDLTSKLLSGATTAKLTSFIILDSATDKPTDSSFNVQYTQNSQRVQNSKRGLLDLESVSSIAGSNAPSTRGLDVMCANNAQAYSASIQSKYQDEALSHLNCTSETCVNDSISVDLSHVENNGKELESEVSFSISEAGAGGKVAERDRPMLAATENAFSESQSPVSAPLCSHCSASPEQKEVIDDLGQNDKDSLQGKYDLQESSNDLLKGDADPNSVLSPAVKPLSVLNLPFASTPANAQSVISPHKMTNHQLPDFCHLQEQFTEGNHKSYLTRDSLQTADNVRAMCEDQFLSYEPDMQLHHLIRKQDLMIKSQQVQSHQMSNLFYNLIICAQEKIELLEMELQIYRAGPKVSGLNEIDRQFPTGMKYQDLKSHLARQTRNYEGQPPDTADQIRVGPRRISSVLTNADSVAANSASSSTRARALTCDQSTMTVRDDIYDSPQACSSNQAHPLPVLMKSKGTEYEILVDTVLEKRNEQVGKADISAKSKSTDVVRMWADSLAGSEEGKYESAMAETLCSAVAVDMLTRLESKIESKVNSAFEKLEKKEREKLQTAPALSKMRSAESVDLIDNKPLCWEFGLSRDTNASLEMSELHKSLEKMLLRFELTLDTRLKECIENLRQNSAIKFEVDQLQRLSSVGGGKCRSPVKGPGISVDTHTEVTQPSIQVSDKYEDQSDFLYGLYQSQDSHISHFTDAVSLSPTRPSSPGHPGPSLQSIGSASVPIRKLGNSPLSELSTNTAVSQIIAQYLPEHEMTDPSSKGLVDSSQNSKVDLKLARSDKKPSQRTQFPTKPELMLDSVGNRSVSPGLQTAHRTTPRGISFRQLTLPRAKRALVSSLHAVELDNQARCAVDNEGWLLGNSCSSIISMETQTTASSSSLWQSSPGCGSALYKRSITRDTVRLVQDCPHTESANSRRGMPVSVSLI